jgi:hypothetical protein
MRAAGEDRLMAQDYESYAKKYLPRERVRILFIAEAPPCSTDRYFYFEKVRQYDGLWIALMKALYFTEWNKTKTKYHRERKKEWLQKFANSGYLLIDAVKVPIEGSDRRRVTEISRCSTDLIAEIRGINPEKIVLIKTTVHDALFTRLQTAGLPVMNEIPLPFPSSGHQTEFHALMSNLDLS